MKHTRNEQHFKLSLWLDLFVWTICIVYTSCAGLRECTTEEKSTVGIFPCPLDYSPVYGADVCVQVFVQRRTGWDEMVSFCTANDASPINIPNQLVQAKLEAGLSHIPQRFWIDLHEVNNQFVWRTTNARPTYSNWHPGSPKALQNRQCAYWSHGVWDETLCTVPLTNVCKKDFPARLPPPRIFKDVDTLAMGSTPNFTCEAFVHYVNGTINFYIIPGEHLRREDLHSFNKIHGDDITFSQQTKVWKYDDFQRACIPMNSKWVKWKMITDYNNTKLICCTENPEVCSQEEVLVFAYRARTPEISVEPNYPLVGSKAVFACKTYPGRSGKLTWKLSQPSTNFLSNFSISRTGQLIGSDTAGSYGVSDGDDVFNITAHPVRKVNGEPVMESQISFTARPKMMGLTFTCSTGIPGESGKRIKLLVRENPKTFIVPDVNSEKTCTVEEYIAQFPCGPVQFMFLDVLPTTTCILPVHEGKTYDEARAVCVNKHDADLLRIDRWDEDYVVSEFLPNPMGYWIGLHDRKKKGSFTWLDDTSQPSFFNWRTSGSASEPSGSACVVKDGDDGTWVKSKCNDRYYFLCQKLSGRNPGPPELELVNDSGQRTFWAGRSLVASCSAPVEHFKDIHFQVVAQDALVAKDGINSSVTYVEEGKYIRDGERCWPLSKASLEVNMTLDLNNTAIKCCWVKADGFSNCAQTLPIQVKLSPLPPELVVVTEFPVYEGSPILASCSAYVGTAGELVWQLQQLSGEAMVWRVQLNGHVSMRNARREWQLAEDGIFNMTNITWKVSENTVVGPQVNSTFQTAATVDMDGARLSCRSFIPGHARVNTLDNIMTSHYFIVLELPGRPLEEDWTTEEIYLLLGILIMAVIWSVLCIFLLLPAPVARRRDTEGKKNLLRKDQAIREHPRANLRSTRTDVRRKRAHVDRLREERSRTPPPRLPVERPKARAERKLSHISSKQTLVSQAVSILSGATFMDEYYPFRRRATLESTV